ncbi:MAG: lysoplasmalogenase [Caulobacteraceae bacterium]
MIEVLAASPAATIAVPAGALHGVLVAAFSVVVSLIYGFFFARAPASPSKMLIKTIPVAALAVAVWMMGGPALTPWALVAGLALSALGDACLAAEGKWALPAGMAAFFAAHVAYIALFLTRRAELFWVTHEIWPIIAGALLAAGAIFILRAVWAHLGALRIPVVAYAGVILGMVISAFYLPGAYDLVMIGAVMFMASDAILSIALFNPEPGFAGGRAGSLAIWFLYYFGQLLIAAGFILNQPVA